MNEIRVLTAFIIFSISSYLVYDLFANGFSWMVLMFCIGGYIAVHFILPKRSSDESHWYDIVEIIIDIPYRSIAFSIRSLTKIFKNGDIDIGIDP